MIYYKRLNGFILQLILPFWLANVLHASEETSIKTISEDWVVNERSSGEESWSCNLEFDSWKYDVTAFYIFVEGFSTASGLWIEASNVLGGKKHWWYAVDEPVPLDLGGYEFMFIKRDFSRSYLSLEGSIEGFLDVMSQFENVNLKVIPNRWSDKADWGKTVMTINQVGLKDALSTFIACTIKYR